MGVREYFSTFKELIGVLRTRRYLAPRPLATIDSIGARVEENAARFGDRPMVLFEGRELTWRQFNELANRYAHALKARSIGYGDVVSLLMENRIEFLAVLVAISKLGAITSLINTNLRGRPLAHCISVTRSKACIFGEELSTAIAEVKAELPLAEGSDYLFVADHGSTPAPNWANDLSADARTADATNPPDTQRVKLGDNATFIFTSGTTGLPKAAVMSQRRLFRRLIMDRSRGVHFGDAGRRSQMINDAVRPTEPGLADDFFVINAFAEEAWRGAVGDVPLAWDRTEFHVRGHIQTPSRRLRLSD